MLRATSTFAKRFRHQFNASRDSGQSLIETALALPFLLLIALNAINFAYYFFVAINLAAAPRNAVEYSVQGFDTPGQLNIPNAGNACTFPAGNPTDKTYQVSVSTLAYDDIIRVLPNTGSGTPCPNIGWVQVCNSNQQNPNKGEHGTLATLATTCQQFGPNGGVPPAPFNTEFNQYGAPPDPEAPNFLLDRVDVVYVVKPLVAGNIFGIFNLFLPLDLNGNYTFHRQVSMREM